MVFYGVSKTPIWGEYGLRNGPLSSDKVRLGLKRFAAVLGGAPIFSYVVVLSVSSDRLMLLRYFSVFERILGNSDFSSAIELSCDSKSEYSTA